MESLTAQLEALKNAQVSTPTLAPTGDAARGAIDFASASAVGSALGFCIDYWLNSSPWGLITGLLVGVVAGFRMMLRTTMRDIASTPVAPDATSNTNER